MADRLYEYEETRELVVLVTDAAERVRTKAETAFDDFRGADNRWRQGRDSYLCAGS